MIDGRKRVAAALASLCIAALGGTVLTTIPSSAEPTISDVKTQVDDLYHQAEIASERYNEARERLADAQSRLASLQADLRREQRAFDEVRREVAATLVAEYQSQAISTTGQVLFSEDPDSFLAQLQTASAFNDRRGAALQRFAVQAKRLALREAAAEREVAQIAETEKGLAADKATIEEKAAEAKALLARLEAAERRRMLAASRSEARSSAAAVPTADVPASGRAKAVVAYALAQVGDPYVWGAAGPNGFDCSGLTMAAWAQAGVGLPHSSAAQRGYGAPVSASALQPGDLVFYYSPISHVGIYIGGGRIVHAGNPRTGVRIDGLYSMPFVGAVRPG